MYFMSIKYYDKIFFRLYVHLIFRGQSCIPKRFYSDLYDTKNIKFKLNLIGYFQTTKCLMSPIISAEFQIF